MATSAHSSVSSTNTASPSAPVEAGDDLDEYEIDEWDGKSSFVHHMVRDHE